jgi:aminoglycoside phosphotransferase (APT) family kinase protein
MDAEPTSNEAVREAVRVTLGEAWLSHPARIEPLFKGDSRDRKFVVYHDHQPRWLVRLSRADDLPRREHEARLLSLHRARGVPCPEVLGSGLAAGASFLVTTYLAGDSADEVLPGLPDEQQHAIGRAAGSTLALLHQQPGRESPAQWLARRTDKYRLRLEQARQLGLSFPGHRGIEQWIEQTLPILAHSPVGFQHDDFHPANLIVRDGRFAGVIDFNRCDDGDPIEEFYKIPWFTLTCSVPFARGQVAGYLAATPCDTFWIRYHLFIAMNLHGAMVWIRRQDCPADIAIWDARVADIVSTHVFSSARPPAWFVDSGR